MRSDSYDTDSYLAPCRYGNPEPCGDNLEAEADDARARLEVLDGQRVARQLDGAQPAGHSLSPQTVGMGVTEVIPSLTSPTILFIIGRP